MGKLVKVTFQKQNGISQFKRYIESWAKTPRKIAYFLKNLKNSSTTVNLKDVYLTPFSHNAKCLCESIEEGVV